MRVLFVDDEPRVLEGLERMLFEFDDWELAFVTSGLDALDELAREPYDVIVSDMRMPVMDGAVLLSRVKELYPQVVRIVLSGYSEVEGALRAVPVAHQFLSKPCSAEQLITVLERQAILSTSVNAQALPALVGDMGGLPPAPAIYDRLTRMLADDDCTLRDVAELVEHDMALTSKLLQVTNSAFFRAAREITSVPSAVGRLGLDVVRGVVLATGLSDELQPPDDMKGLVARINDHCMAVAGRARRIAAGREGADGAFLAGLLHDVGVLVLMAKLPDRYRPIIGRAAEHGERIDLVELDALGVTHAVVGAYLLGLWGLPMTVVEAVMHHHEPAFVAGRGLDAASVLQLAEIVSGEDHCVGHPPAEPAEVEALLERTGASLTIAELRALAVPETS